MCASFDENIQRWCEESSNLDQELPAQPVDTTAAAVPRHAHRAGILQQGLQQHDLEGIVSAFSPIAVMGIRSLPDALHPGYRMELMTQLQVAEKQRQQSNSFASGSGQQPDQQRNLKGSVSMGAGQVPQRYGPLDGYFTSFKHLTSEYERRDMVEKFAKLHSKLQQVGADDFVVRNVPAPCQHSTTFTAYPHDLPPYTEVDHMGRPLHSQQQRVRPFIPPGRGSSPVVLLPDLLQGLDAALSKDWPRSFIKAFVDHEGSVVLSFDRAAAALEGDLTAYLNHQEKHGSMMVEFRLAKDPDRWGVLEGDAASVFYVLIPPWCRSRPGMEH